MKTYLRILRYLIPYIPALSLSIILSIVFSGANILVIPLTRDIITEISHKNLTHFNNQVFNAIALFSLRLVGQFGQYYLTNRFSTLLTIDIQMDLYRKLQYVSSHFHAKWKLGEILTRLSSDVGKVKEAIMTIFFEILPQGLTLIGILTYLFLMNWKLTLLALLATPAFVAMLAYSGKKLKKVAKQTQRKAGDISHLLQETLSNTRLVQAYNREEQEISRFKKESMRNFKINMRGIKVKTTIEPIITFLQFLVIIIIIWYGGYEIAKGNLNGPTLTSFFLGLFMLIDPILVLSKVYNNLQQAHISANRFFEVLDDPIVITNHPNAIKPTITGNVSFNNVCFSYEENQPFVLNQINLKAEKGEVIALVGLSGVGKSTLINLIPRFYDPVNGSIEIDGENLKNIDLFTLRSQLGIVPQDDIMFRGTILENIRYGKLEATEEEVILAAKKANAWEFIHKMRGELRARLHDRGSNLSGGQKQRISIARAILRNPKILILDEATSALDPESEKLVQDALYTLMENRTTFVIAHRLSTVMHADKIVVMDKGAIKEMGKHDELLKQDGLYAKLFHLQFEKSKHKK
jgi:ATP-binding cassette, subfamily B, bacterial MsbA